MLRICSRLFPSIGFKSKCTDTTKISLFVIGVFFTAGAIGAPFTTFGTSGIIAFSLTGALFMAPLFLCRNSIHDKCRKKSVFFNKPKALEMSSATCGSQKDHLFFCHDQHILITWGKFSLVDYMSNSHIVVWNINECRFLFLLPEDVYLNVSLVEAQFIVTINSIGILSIWNIQTQTCEFITSIEISNKTIFAQKGKLLVISEKETMQVFDCISRKEILSMRGKYIPTNDSKYTNYCVIQRDEKLLGWDLEKQKKLWKAAFAGSKPHAAWIDPGIAVIAFRNGDIFILDPNKNKKTNQLKSKITMMSSLEIKDHFLLVKGFDQSCEVFDLQQGKSTYFSDDFYGACWVQSNLLIAFLKSKFSWCLINTWTGEEDLMSWGHLPFLPYLIFYANKLVFASYSTDCLDCLDFNDK